MDVLKKEFQTKPFQKVNIKAITEELQIARGSFYQYFENLEDSYFTILDRETIDIHQIFMKLFIEKEKDLHQALKAYGEQLAEILFQEESYMIYKNRYLYWNEDLNQGWNRRQAAHFASFRNVISESGITTEKLHFIKSVIHSIIQRNFQEEWSSEVFCRSFRRSTCSALPLPY